MQACQLACTNMPTCRGISTASLLLLLGDGTIATTGPVMARCGTLTVPCPAATLTFELSAGTWQQAAEVHGVGVTIDTKTVQGTSMSITVSGAQTGAYIRLPVVAGAGTGTDAEPTLAAIIIAALAVPAAIAGLVFRMHRLS